MKHILAILVLIVSLSTYGQEDLDFNNLVKLGEIYSKNVNATGSDFKMAVEELRTPELSHIIDGLIAIGEADKKLLTKEFLSKPSETELKYWYVLREIHYNNQSENVDPRPNNEVAREIIEKKIDSRWLLDNYYYRICTGIAKLFNNKNLSKYNFDLDDYRLENETEKAIFYFSVTNSLIQRFRVLQMMKNYEKLLAFAKKLPKFNGKPYYEYTSFDFDDFDWIGYEKTESYKERHLGSLYSALNGHFSAIAEKGKRDDMSNLYFNSILFIPDYFKYSGGMAKDLQELYKQSKK